MSESTKKERTSCTQITSTELKNRGRNEGEQSLVLKKMESEKRPKSRQEATLAASSCIE